MSEAELLKVALAGIFATLIAQMVAVFIFFKSQSRQDKRDDRIDQRSLRDALTNDQRKLRDAQRERIRSGSILMLEQAWLMRRFMVEHGEFRELGDDDRQIILADLRKIAESKDKTNAVISIDVDNRSITDAFAAYVQTYEDFTHAYAVALSGSKYDPIELDAKMLAARAESLTKLSKLTKAALEQLEAVTKPL